MLHRGRGIMPPFAFLTAAQQTALIDSVRGQPAAAGASGHAAPGSAGGTDPREPPYTTGGFYPFLDPDGFPALRPPWGTLNALDLNTGEYRWQRVLGETPGLPGAGAENQGGPLVTAGGVVFIAATKDEKIRAFDSATGRLLWESALPAGGYVTPVTYSVAGRQFVVIACGGNRMGTKPGSAYVAFALPEK
jgi:quinoprotein glucose dehydrogenase